MRNQYGNHKLFALLLAVVVTTSGFVNSTRASVGASAPADNVTNATSAGPANDNLVDAQLLTGNSGSINANNSAATKEANEPIHALNKGGASVWYKIVAGGNGVLTVETGGSAINTLLAVYKGSTVSTLQLIAANDDYRDSGGGALTSRVRCGTQNGATYYIAVDGKDNETGTFKLTYSLGNAMTSDAFNIPLGFASITGHTDFTASNVGAGKEAGEPNHAGNAGGRSIWFKLSNGFSYPRAFTFSVTSRKVDNPGQGMKTLAAVYTGANVADLTLVANRQFTEYGTVTVRLEPLTNYYLALDGFDNGSGAETGTFTVAYGPARNDKQPDFDGDEITDLTVFRPTTGFWYTLESVTGNLRAVQFGANGDRPLIGDFDRDGKVDYAVFRPDTGFWYLNNSTTGFQAFSWGMAGDVPLVRNINVGGTRVQATMVFRPTTGIWYPYVLGAQPIVFGQLGDIPFSEDFSGDGTDEFAVFRPSNGTWYILDLVANQFRAVPFGLTGDKPVVADYDADGIADIAVFRPSTGIWYLIASHNNAVQAIGWGLMGDRPQVAHFNRDAEAELGVYRNGNWYFRNSVNGSTIVASFGTSTDVPVSSPLP